jgi:glycine hydroxymethyltransferase
MLNIYDLLRNHEKLISESIPLIASENITSLLVRACLLSDFGHRYAIGEVGERVYSGCQYIDQVERLAIELSKKLFKADYVNVRAISGTVANLAIYTALSHPGGKIAAVPVEFGGHTSHFDTAEVRGLKTIKLPFSPENFNVNTDEAEKLIRKERPEIVMLGASVILFPHPVKELSEVCNDVGATLVYDASHVLGLIAGKKFQDPLKEGAKIVTASTHKTFPGPQRAVIVGRELGELIKRIDRAVMPGVVSNHHLHSLAAYVVACMEMIEFGESYARQIVRNSKALAERLYELDFKVVGENIGFTETHQVVFEGSAKDQLLLERAGIFVNVWPSTSLVRVGVQEVTRRGMREEEMRHIADLMYMCLKGNDVREEVRELAMEFDKIHYSFSIDKAYLRDFDFKI